MANVGVGIANSGVNLAVGNASANQARITGDDGFQSADIASGEADPAEFLALGPVTAANSGEASNSSDGEACVCTGDAVASGNVSSTTLTQDLDLSTGGGLVIVTETGGVLNAGVGLANSGLNLAIGNISNNIATTQQDSTINDALLPIALAQTANNGGTASNNCDGAGKVATGNAKGTGNLSTTNFAQAADVDSALAVSSITGGTTNAGLGLANAGLNLGIGNASTNRAFLEQDADGSGIVSNDGEADQRLGRRRHDRRSVEVRRRPRRDPGDPGQARCPRPAPHGWSDRGRGRHRPDAPPRGLRPAPEGSEPGLIWRSSQGTNEGPASRRGLRRCCERVTGIEPAFSAWEADVLPLNYTRRDRSA